MPNTQQARTPTRNVRGEAPVRHWLLVGHHNVFSDGPSLPSRAQAAQPKSPSGSVSKSKQKQRGRSVKKATVESAAPFASSRAFSAGRYKDAHEGEGNVSGIDTAYLTSTSGRPSQSRDEDAESAQCAPAVVAALQKTEACTPTRKEPRGQQHSAESSVVRPTSPLEHAEDGVGAVQMRDSSRVPTQERAALLPGSLRLSSPAPSGEDAGDMAPSVGVMRSATTVPAASAKNAFRQQPDASTAVNINDAGTGCALACLPETPHRPMQVRFFRSSKPRWQGARTPNETVLEADNDGNGTGTHGDQKNFIQSHARDRVPHEETGPCVTPPRTPHAVSTITTLQEKGEAGIDFGGEDGAVADACGCLNAPTTAVVVCEQSQVNASLKHSPPSPVLPVLPRTSAALNATEELSTAAATTSFRCSDGSPIPPPIPPYPNNREESTANATPLRHSDTANPALWQRGGPGDGDEGCMCVEGPHTPDVVREALPRRLQSASPSLQESVNAISSFFPAGRPDSRKRVSPSSGRGPSSSYGCSDGGSTLESHQTRRLTPYCDTDEEDDSRGISASRNVTRPLEESAQEAEQLHHRLPAEDVMAAAGPPGACLSSTDSAVTPSATLLRCNDDLALLSSHVQAEEPVCPREVSWRSALQFSHTLLAEYQRSVLTAFMTVCKAAWLPSMAVCRLGYVCTLAYASPRVAEQALATGITVSEVHLLFQLCCTSPSESAAEQLVDCFFATQLVRYVNWVHQLQFEYLYVRMVALRAVSMMELHERRLICMQRDLGIRDAIELFMLLAPRPHAPMVSTGRRVFSAFRMALHALGGGGNAGATTASAKRRGSCSARTQHKPSSPATPPRVEPLFASETWNAARATCDVSAVTSPTNDGAGDNHGDARDVVRKVAGATNPPPETPECHRVTPRLLNTTYSNDCRPVAERRSGGGVSSVLPVLWLPKFIRSTPRTASVAHKTRKETDTVAAKTDCSEVERQDKDGFPRRGASSVLSSRSPNHRELGRRNSRDAALLNGGLRARETVQPKKRSRTPPPLPTDADFVNLHDAEVLKRFVK